jgi:hypothetical protein
VAVRPGWLPAQKTRWPYCGYALISENSLCAQLKYTGAFAVAAPVRVGIYPDVICHKTYASVQVSVQPRGKVVFFAAGDILILKIHLAVACSKFPGAVFCFWPELLESPLFYFVATVPASDEPAAVHIPAIKVGIATLIIVPGHSYFFDLASRFLRRAGYPEA